MSHWIRNNKEVSWTTHAGYHRGQYHRNSRESLEAANTIDVDRIEFDVIPAIGGLVLAHDLGDAASRETISLEEGLAILAEGDKDLSCDVKGGGGEEIAKAILKFGLEKRTLVCGHDDEELALMHEIYPFPRGWSFPQPAGSSSSIYIPDWQRWRMMQLGLEEILERSSVGELCEGFMLRYDIVDKNIVDMIHDWGGWATAWTVDDAETITKLKDTGVDNITSNSPLEMQKAWGASSG